MKKIFNEIIFGKSSLKGGLLALTIVGLIVLGCTCNTKEGFKFGGKKDTKTTDKNSVDPKTVKKSDASKGELPSDSESRAIAKATLLSFNNALQTNNFKNFYGEISNLFKKSTSPRRLRRQFKSFIDGRADLSSIRSMNATFTMGPRIDTTKRLPVLEMNGEYATTPIKSTFQLKYIPEGSEWKLFSIRVFTGIRK